MKHHRSHRDFGPFRLRAWSSVVDRGRSLEPGGHYCHSPQPKAHDQTDKTDQQNSQRRWGQQQSQPPPDRQTNRVSAVRADRVDCPRWPVAIGSAIRSQDCGVLGHGSGLSALGVRVASHPDPILARSGPDVAVFQHQFSVKANRSNLATILLHHTTPWRDCHRGRISERPFMAMIRNQTAMQDAGAQAPGGLSKGRNSLTC